MEGKRVKGQKKMEKREKKNDSIFRKPVIM